MTRPIRVVHVIARMNVGGPAVLIANTMRDLNGHDVDGVAFDLHLITGWCAPDEQDYLLTQAEDVTAIRIDGLGRSVRPWSDATSVGSLVRVLRRWRPDVVHTHTAKAGVLGRLAARRVHPRPAIVHTYHGHLLHGYFSPGKTRAVIAIERRLAALSDRLIAVGAQVRDDLLAAGIGSPSQYEVIPPGLAEMDLPDGRWARAELGLPDGVPVFTMMGRLTGIKRPDRFADAVDMVSRAHPDAVFAVAGSGDLAGELDRTVRERGLAVHLLGWRSDVATVLAASDAMVLTSDNEGTPLSLIQAGMAGIPVVATDVGAVGDVVRNGVTGILVPPSAVGVAEGMSRLLGDPSLARRLGEQARSWTRQTFSTDAMARHHARLYSALAQQRGVQTVG